MSRRILWCDAEANSLRLSNRDGIIDVIDKAIKANIDTLIVDVKPLSGEVLYNSQYAPRFRKVDGQDYPPDFDLLSVMIEEGHARNIKIHAGINIFSEGHRQWSRGPAYSHADWQVVSYEINRKIDISGFPPICVRFVDPWEMPDEPAIYTKRSGASIKTSRNITYITIVDKCISSVISNQEAEIAVPINGCIIAYPDDKIESQNLAERDVVWHSEPVFRTCKDSAMPSWGIFVNPAGPARGYELQIIQEIISNYDIDGIVYDRMRYPNLYADFSLLSRELFESWLCKGHINWPDDIFRINDEPWLPIVEGIYYKEWLEWRALQIKKFAEDAVKLSRDVKPGLEVGVYVGSWYESYFDVGVNWGSETFHAGYRWMTRKYNKTGYAELFDFICTGCYYPYPTRADARLNGRPEGATVEAGCEISKIAISNASKVYGSLYIRDYAGNETSFIKAINTVLDCSDGIMLFDLVYLDNYNWWNILFNR